MKAKNIKYFMTPMLLALNISLVGCASNEKTEITETETTDVSSEEPIEITGLDLSDALGEEKEEQPHLEIPTMEGADSKSTEEIGNFEKILQEGLSSEEETSSEHEDVSEEDISEDVEEKPELEEDPQLTRLKELATVNEIFITGNGRDNGYEIQFTSKDNDGLTYLIKDGIDETRDFLDTLIFTDESLVNIVTCDDLEIVKAISHPENIKSLSMKNCPMYDVSFLEDYKNLESLRIQDCPNLGNIDALWNLTGLRGIELVGTSVSNISALSNLKDIIYLDLRCNKIEDATPLHNLPRLQTLHLEYNEFWDDETLKFLVESGILSDDKKQVIVMTSHSDGIGILPKKYVNQTSFNELFIKKLESKEEWDGDRYYLELRDENGVCCLYTLINGYDDINLFQNTYNRITLSDIDDLSILEKIENKDTVTELNLAFCSMNSLDGIEAFSNIENLNISNCDSLSDISELASTPNISSIIIKNTPVSDISSLSSLENLEYIWLSYTYVKDLDPILSLPNLKEGNFYWNHIQHGADFITLRNKGISVDFNFGTRSKGGMQVKEYINEK